MQSDAATAVLEPRVPVGWGDALGVPFDPTDAVDPDGAEAPDPLHDATNDEASATTAYRRILNRFLLGLRALKGSQSACHIAARTSPTVLRQKRPNVRDVGDDGIEPPTITV